MKAIKLIKRLPFWSLFLILAGVMMFVINGFYWYSSVYSRPERMLRDAFSQALQTYGVTYQDVTSQADVNLQNTSSVRFSGNFNSQTISVATSTHDLSKIITEIVTANNKQFLRYKELSSDAVQLKNNYQNVWTIISDGASKGSMSYMARAMTATPIMLANLSSEQHATMVNELAKGQIYHLERVTKKSQTIDGQKVAIFDVAVDPVQYRRFKRLVMRTAGLGQDAELFQGNDQTVGQRVYLQVAVSFSSHQFVRAAWGTLSNSYTTSYSGWGANRVFEAPTQTISFVELQKRIFSGVK